MHREPSPAVCLLDPCIDSPNTGDQIISAAVLAILEPLIRDLDLNLVRLPTQRPLTREERRTARSCKKFIVGGTNLLSSNMQRYRQWRIGPRELEVIRGEVTLMGVGWWQYQDSPNAFTRVLLRRLLRADGHSVRDGMSRSQLAAAGIDSINTACPTMWELPPEPELSKEISGRVVIVLTDYNPEPEQDYRLIEVCRANYSEVVVWPQGAQDSSYIRSLDTSITILPPGLAQFDVVLKEGADYIGTRLHAGIRALQSGNRSTILAVDNRAIEISRDTNLPVISRDFSKSEERFLFDPRIVQITNPHENISQWKRGLVEWLGSA